MVGNKAQKAVAAALTGIMALGSAAPAFAAVNLGNGWTRLDGTYKTTVTEKFDTSRFGKLDFITKGTVDGVDRYDTMLDMALFNSKDQSWGNFNVNEKEPELVTDQNGNVVFYNKVSDVVYYLTSETTNESGKTTTTTYSFVEGDPESYYTIVNGTYTFYGKGALDAEDELLNNDMDGLVSKNIVPVVTDGSFDWNYASPSTIILVSGTSYADSLSASGLAGFYGCPIITTPGDKLGEEAEKAIRWFASNSPVTTEGRNPKNVLNVIIVGGEAAVSEGVAKSVKAVTTNAEGRPDTIKVNVKRIGGADRMQTSLNVMKKIVKEKTILATNAANKYTLDPSRQYIFVANGTAWADALSSSSFSYVNAAPTLLTDGSGNFTQEQLDYLKLISAKGAYKINVIGGPAESAYNQLRALDAVTFEDEKGSTTELTQATWIHGADRYDTGRIVVETLAGQNEYRDVAVATGKNWPDALVGGAFVGARDGILVLVEDGRYDALEAALKASSRGGLLDQQNFVIGGKSAVSADLAEDLVRLY